MRVAQVAPLFESVPPRVYGGTERVVAYLVDGSGLIRIDPAVYFIDRLPVHTEVRDVIIVVVASVLVALAATLYPSRTAARLAPVEAIRHE